MSNTKNVRMRNSLKTLREFMSGGEYTKNDIAKKVQLTLVTSSKIINEMHENNILMEKGIADSDLGRKASMYTLNPKRFYICGVVLGLEFFYIEVLDLKKEALYKKKAPLDSTKSFDESIKMLIREMQGAFTQLGISSDLLLGIGVAVPGVVDSGKGKTVVLPNMPTWNNAPIRDVLEKEFSTLVLVEKDNFASILYLKAVSEPKLNNAIILTIMGGIGCGILTGGGIYRGETGLAGEVGHLSFGDDGRELESYASDIAITGDIGKIWEQEGRIKPGERITVQDAVHGFKSGDSACKEVFSRAELYLGRALVTLIRLYNPKQIFIDSEWVRELPKVFTALNNRVRQLNDSLPSGGTKLICIKDTDTLLRGASMLVYDYILNHGTRNKLIGD